MKVTDETVLESLTTLCQKLTGRAPTQAEIDEAKQILRESQTP